MHFSVKIYAKVLIAAIYVVALGKSYYRTPNFVQVNNSENLKLV